MTTLQEAAKAVVERWDSPKWKDLPHTAEFIDALRTALGNTRPLTKAEKQAMWDAVAKDVKRQSLVLRYWYLKGIADAEAAHQIKEVR